MIITQFITQRVQQYATSVHFHSMRLYCLFFHSSLLQPVEGTFFSIGLASQTAHNLSKKMEVQKDKDLCDMVAQFQATTDSGEWKQGRGATKPHMRHIRQRRSWDCGMACVQMVVHLHNDHPTWKEMYQICNTSSIWTVHLSSMLLQRGVQHSIVTTCAGVNQDLESMSFYRAHIEKEKEEVLTLFEESVHAGIKIIERGFTANEFRQLLLKRRVVLILLVDNRGLRCIECGCMKRNWLSCSFTGHYVVVSSYDKERNAFVYHDPAERRVTTCWMSMEDFDRCRLVKGTDEDVVIVPY